MTKLTIAFIYLQPTRPKRLVAALTDASTLFGADTIYTLIYSIREYCNNAHERGISRSMQYNFSIITLQYFGVNGPAASAIIKEAWKPGSILDQIAYDLKAQEATHPASHASLSN